MNGDEWHERESGLLPVIEWKEVNPGLSGNPVNLKKEAFLKFKCLYFWENPYTVHDILKFYAYVRGGIHLDKGEEKYQPLREAFEAFQLNGLSSRDHSMRGIVQVIYTTLSKYKEELLAGCPIFCFPPVIVFRSNVFSICCSPAFLVFYFLFCCCLYFYSLRHTDFKNYGHD